MELWNELSETGKRIVCHNAFGSVKRNVSSGVGAHKKSINDGATPQPNKN